MTAPGANPAMISYAQRQINAEFLKVYGLSLARVAKVPSHLDESGREIRCHELARAVARELLRRASLGTPSIRVVDGRLGVIAHSWLELTAASKDQTIMDVYTPGRVPQVQLIDKHPIITDCYKEDPTFARLHISLKIVNQLCCLMQGPESSTTRNTECPQPGTMLIRLMPNE